MLMSNIQRTFNLLRFILSRLNKNLAIANRSRVSCTVRTQYVEDSHSNPVTFKSRFKATQGH